MFYNINTITNNQILDALNDCDIIKSSQGNIINASNSFDIEVSSFYHGELKRACMYVWGMCINGLCIYGRTWIEFIEFCYRLNEILCLNKKLRLIIYVHNLSYEFQFIRKFFEWSKIFARKKRKPITALAELGIEFRCSYFLSGYALKTVAKNLNKYSIEKLDEDFDYELVRHSKTVLEEKELNYLNNDILIVHYYIKEEMERNGDITKIPLTQTGYVRNYVRNKCLPKDDRKSYLKYKNIIRNLTISDDEYPQLKRAFAGGLTHASAFHSNKTIENVSSFDLASSYPSIIINEKFPMSTAEIVNVKSKTEFRELINSYCCIFDIEFVNIYPKIVNEHILSASRCWKKDNSVIDNGRIVSADLIRTTLTEIDYQTIEQFYTWDDFYISNFRIYEKSYLPKPFVEAALQLYYEKTTLKGVKDMELEYMHSKQLINSMFGMCVTDIIMDDVTYINNEWGEVDNSKSLELLEKYNTAKSRFLFYPWGVYITAYARRNLCTAIIEYGEDYIYSDTDSIKGTNYKTHELYINEYNQNVKRKNITAMEHHKLPIELTYPKDKQGIERHLGIWEYEETYKRFKTLGAKRYLTQTDKGNSFTVSGVIKQAGMNYIESLPGDIFDNFSNELVIPPGNAGKNAITYLDNEFSGVVTDYLGVESEYEELSACHIEPAGYTFNLSVEYLNYLSTINKEFDK